MTTYGRATTKKRGGLIMPALRQIGRDMGAWRELRATPYGVAPVAIISAVTFFQILDSRAASLAGPEIVRRLGINVAGLATLAELTGFVGLFAALGIGWWADRHHRVPLLIAGTAISGTMAGLSGFGHRFLTFGGPRLADDAANLVADVPARSLLADYYPVDQRGKVFALLAGVGTLAGLAALPLTGLTITHFGLGPTFLITGVPIALMAVVVAFKLREPVRGYFERRAMGGDATASAGEEEPVSFGEGWRTIWSIRTVRRVFIAQMIQGIGNIPFALFYGLFLFEHYHLDAAQRGFIQIPSAAFAVLGAIIGGGLLDRLGRVNPGRAITVLGSFAGIAAFGLFIVAFGFPLPILMLATATFSFGTSLVGPAYGAVLSQVIPANIRTQGLQLIGLATLPGILFGFPISAIIYGDYGYTQTFLFGVPFFVIGAFVAASAGGFFEFDRRNALAKALARSEWERSVNAGEAKMLVCRGVDVEYDGVQVLFGVDFDVEEGQLIALLGTNGAGKSTLLCAISGSQEASSGSIVFDGRDITHMPPHEIAQRSVIHMPGGRGVFPGLTVGENLLLGNWMTDGDEEVRRRLAEALGIFPILRERQDALASALSGGEQQMLSLAQAFMARPRLLMIDELSLGLAPAVVAQLLEVVRRIHESGVTIIIVEQSVNVALTIAEKAIFMEKGEVRFFGDTADLLGRPDILRSVYVKGTGSLGATVARATHVRPEGPSILEVENVTKRFGGVTALDEVALQLAEGAVLGVIGPNGSGKTTLFEIISGFQRPDTGRVRYDGLDITDLSADERARRRLIRRFQDARLFPSLTVFETMLVALDRSLETRSAVFSAAGWPSARRAERRLRVRADRLIDLFDLGSYRDKFVKELSTGLRRIVDIAWVLAQEPKVLLLDEPSSGIAQAEAENLAPLLGRVRFETGCGILIIEHDMSLISSVADELIALDQGQVVMRDVPEVVLNDDRVIESYLGTTQETIARSGRT